MALSTPGRRMAFSLGSADDQGLDAHFYAKMALPLSSDSDLFNRSDFALSVWQGHIQRLEHLLIFKPHNIQVTAAPLHRTAPAPSHVPRPSHSYLLLSPWCPTQPFNLSRNHFNGIRGPSMKEQICREWSELGEQTTYLFSDWHILE